MRTGDPASNFLYDVSSPLFVLSNVPPPVCRRGFWDYRMIGRSKVLRTVPVLSPSSNAASLESCREYSSSAAWAPVFCILAWICDLKKEISTYNPLLLLWINHFHIICLHLHRHCRTDHRILLKHKSIDNQSNETTVTLLWSRKFGRSFIMILERGGARSYKSSTIDIETW